MGDFVEAGCQISCPPDFEFLTHFRDREYHEPVMGRANLELEKALRRILCRGLSFRDHLYDRPIESLSSPEFFQIDDIWTRS